MLERKDKPIGELMGDSHDITSSIGNEELVEMGIMSSHVLYIKDYNNHLENIKGKGL